MWMIWHHKFAEGPEKEHWLDLGACKSMEAAEVAAKEEVLELKREYEWSDGYRGIEYTIVDRPPADVLHSLITRACRQERYWREQARHLQRLLGEGEKS